VNVQKFRRLFPLIAVALLANALRSTQVAAQRPTLVSINSYAKRVDQFVKCHPQRVFANLMSEKKSEPDRWREFKSAGELESAEATLDESAYAWQKAGKVVAANFTLTSQSGDWVQYIIYYFREDGTLAKIHAQLNTFYGNLSVIREKFYDAGGRLLHRSSKYLDLHSQRPTKSRDFVDKPVPLYLRTRDLPFYKFL